MRNTGQEMTAMNKKTGLILGGMAVALGAIAWPAVQGWATNQNIDVSATVSKFCRFNAVPIIDGLDNATVDFEQHRLQRCYRKSGHADWHSARCRLCIHCKCDLQFSEQLVLMMAKGGLKLSLHAYRGMLGSFNNDHYTATGTWAGSRLAVLNTAGAPCSSPETRKFCKDGSRHRQCFIETADSSRTVTRRRLF